MASETTQTSLNDLTQALIAEASMVLSQGVNLRDYVTQRDATPGHNSVLFPAYSSLTAAALTDGTDLSNSEVTTGGATVTLGEVGVMSTVTDQADFTSAAQVGTDIGRNMGEAIRAKMNQDIWALFDGFTTNTAGTTNTDITEAFILKGIRQLMAQKAPKPYYLAITPHVFEDLITLYTANTSIVATQIRDAAMISGTLPMIYGITPILVDNLASGTSAGKADGADAKCGLFSPAAIGFAKGWDIRIETQRDASMRGTELVATAFYGVAEIVDAYGCEILVDNLD